MNSNGITSESDFFHDFMDFDEFINASAITSMPSPQLGTESQVRNNGHASTEILDDRTELESVTPVHEEHNFERQQMADNGVMAAESMPGFVDPCERQDVTSDGVNLTLDTQNASDTSDTNLSPSPGGGVMKDKRYWERRMKNNIAAKRSRDAKRLKETTIVERWTFLEEENKRLHEQISKMRKRLNAANSIQNNLTV